MQFYFDKCFQPTSLSHTHTHTHTHTVLPYMYSFRSQSIAPSKTSSYKVRPSVSSFNSQYPLNFLWSSSGCLSLPPRLPLTSFLLFIFPQITCFRRYFLYEMWPNQSAFLIFIVSTIFLSFLNVRNAYSFFTRSGHMIFSILLQHHFSNFPTISDLLSDVSKFQHHTRLCSKCSTSPVYYLNVRPICWWKFLFLLNAAFVMTILDLISHVHLAPFVIMPPK